MSQVIENIWQIHVYDEQSRFGGYVYNKYFGARRARASYVQYYISGSRDRIFEFEKSFV